MIKLSAKASIALVLIFLGCLTAAAIGVNSQRLASTIRQIGSDIYDDETGLSPEGSRVLTELLFSGTKDRHFNTALNQLACDYVNNQKLGDGGCYDECIVRASYEVDGKYVNPDGLTEMYDNKKGWLHTPLALSDMYSHELQNACAIVMHGGEY